MWSGEGTGTVRVCKVLTQLLVREVTITRVAITTEKDAENKNTEMGRRALYHMVYIV